MGSLSHLKILDLANETASYCSKILASLGARVIKIEKPGGDSSRDIGPFLNNVESPENSLFFFYNNTDKLGITLNLDTKPGRSIFRKLIRSADIIVETFPPGYLKSLRLDYSHLSKINPRLIMASVTGFGQTGCYSSFESADIVAAAAGGQMYVSGDKDAPPLKLFGEQSFYIASLFAAIGILIALQQRHRDNKGQHIDISSQETTVATLENIMVRYFHENVVNERLGSFHRGNMAGIFPCEDGNLFISFEREWDSLVDWLTAEQMQEDLKTELWQDLNYRRQHIEHIIEIITKWTKIHTVDELFEKAQLMRFPWAPVQNIPQILSNPQLKDRHFFTVINHENLDTSYLYPDTPLKYSSNQQILSKRAPLVGEHSYEVYHQELNLSEKQLARLKILNVI
jgi:benzylsuccinate CoA-transferase BbsE subunit